MKLTEGWTCDVCKQPISCVDEGWVQWLVKGKESHTTGRCLQLVHVQNASPLTDSDFGCQFDGREIYQHSGYIVQNLSLEYFVGPDGLMRLLRMIHEAELPQENVLELAKRLHIPGYEQARPYFKEAIVAGILEPNTPDDYYHQYQIEDTLRYIQGGKHF